MKKSILYFICFVFVSPAFSQENNKNNTNFELGSGLTFNFNDKYEFKLGGMIQPHVAFDQLDDNEQDYYFNAKRTYFNLSGKAIKEKMSFLLQTDFSLSNPLLDAWICYQPVKQLKITVGQKQSIGNNREMMIMEDKLQFTDRGILSNTYSLSGREFGLFLEASFGGNKFMVQPKIAVTSGDGRNSFGSDSRDVDLGGLKYSGRLDVYPFGRFSKGNDDLIADLVHEEKPKLVLGGAVSYNDGASQSVGEGHGDFYIYDGLGGVQLPDYRQMYYDLLFKYKGIRFLGEYVFATATELQGSFTDELATIPLIPTEISEYLALGRAYNLQLGYVTKSGFGVDLRMENSNPEFESNPNTVVTKTDAYGVSICQYFKGNDLKLQASFLQTQLSNNTKLLYGGLTFQLVF